RVARTGWSDHPNAQRWRWVADHVAASAAVAGRALLTVGRQPLPHYRSLPDAVARVVDPPEDTSPLRTIPGWEIIAARGPFTLADERALLSSRAIGTLVTKDSGGPAPKLDAARELGVRVVVVRRPEPPSGLATVPSAEAALAWLAARAS
ncbi:MAG: precorrin-6A/cobalt-precorrin-6A reductase, partial [Propionibacteriaceae bacterium]|nr:precorrin-6A/cobalt-precorrin-6A reductase [Propionibacteriaceae bacterium]